MRSDCFFGMKGEKSGRLNSYVSTAECQPIGASNLVGKTEGKENKSYLTLPPAVDDVEPMLSLDSVSCPWQSFRMAFDGPEKVDGFLMDESIEVMLDPFDKDGHHWILCSAIGKGLTTFFYGKGNTN